MFHNFVDFKMEFDKTWHAGLWHVFRSFNINEGLVQAFQTLYENLSSAVLLNNQLVELFKTVVGVNHRCLLSPILFNFFLEMIMHSMTTIPPSLLVAGPYATYDSVTTLILFGNSSGKLQDIANRLSSGARA